MSFSSNEIGDTKQMETEKDVKTRRRVEEFLRSSKDDIIIAFGISMGFIKSFTDKVDVKKVRRKIEDVCRKDEKLMKSLAQIIKKLDASMRAESKDSQKQ